MISSVAALSERRNRVEAGVSFATTHWSVVAQSALTNAPQAENALAKLCKTYWAPIYSFIRRRGYSPADAQDLTQSLFAFFCGRELTRVRIEYMETFAPFYSCSQTFPLGYMGSRPGRQARRQSRLRFVRSANSGGDLRRRERRRFNGGITVSRLTPGRNY